MSALSTSSISSTHRLLGGERLPQHAAHDVVVDVVHPRVAELRVAQPADRVVLVEALLRLGGRLDVPLQQRHAERPGDLDGEHGLAGAGLALDQQRPLQRDRRVDRERQVLGRNVGLRAFEAHDLVCYKIARGSPERKECIDSSSLRSSPSPRRCVRAAGANADAAHRNKTAMCVGCHGIPGYKTAFPDVYHVPKIAGQQPGYIINALKAYKSASARIRRCAASRRASPTRT